MLFDPYQPLTPHDYYIAAITIGALVVLAGLIWALGKWL